MATRWALVGLMTLAALGCSGSENGRYVPMGINNVWVLDTRTGRACVPNAGQQAESSDPFTAAYDRAYPQPIIFVTSCVELGVGAVQTRDTAARARP
jgi:hypothetical protein